MNIVSIEFIGGILIGILLGIGFTILLSSKTKEVITFEKLFGGTLFLLWMGMHTYGFINEISVDMIFNIVGGFGGGIAVGLKLPDDAKKAIINKIIK